MRIYPTNKTEPKGLIIIIIIIIIIMHAQASLWRGRCHSVHKDREVTANRPDIIIKNKK